MSLQYTEHLPLNCTDIMQGENGDSGILQIDPHKRSKAWFPLDRNRIVKSYDSSRFWLIAERLTTAEKTDILPK